MQTDSAEYRVYNMFGATVFSSDAEGLSALMETIHKHSSPTGGLYRIVERSTGRVVAAYQDGRDVDPRCPDCKGEGIATGTRGRDGSISQCRRCGGSGIAEAFLSVQLLA